MSTTTQEQVLILTDEAMLEHEPGQSHVERPERLQAILNTLENDSMDFCICAKPQAAERKHIARVHSSMYIDRIESIRGKSAQLDLDTLTSPGSVAAAYLAAGACVSAVDEIVTGKVKRAFAIVRPPGHHAEASRAMGFCLFNNIAVAAQHAIAQHALQRVLIVDWDVHHGNGSQHIFESRRDVLFFSVHQWPWYPGTGALEESGVGIGKGFTVNAPLPAGFDDAGYASLFRQVLIPIARKYQPELVLVSAGFDAHRDDPLGGMRLSTNGFASLCQILCDIADDASNGRIALVLEGGYDISALSESVNSCLHVLGGRRPHDVRDQATPGMNNCIASVSEFHRRTWPV